MYAEFSQVSLLSISNSELILVKDETKMIEFDILKRPPLGFQGECSCEATGIYNSSNDRDRERRVPEEDYEEKKGEESNVKEAASMENKNICLGEFKAMIDDDDGFKTPTSLDHRIPEMKQCPPAPRKPKANKRGASESISTAATSSTSRNLQLDLSQVVDSWFPSSLVDDLHRKVKKARTQEN
ncbi:cyclin-dependent protein kinase inhibitor SMR10-like isoform X1 [Hibiscus syriacus]|uniref:cyclin-dependent protein kinase inhibitor SMR10-like isoform X1 n=1 Tax=Hibiscus syriacus TaxID=106335 RepID=UPI0019247E37|nr:cyclin-dependent protein kinase inhibitor SMR10-like isoform X1 [Hibiscus syriacus]